MEVTMTNFSKADYRQFTIQISKVGQKKELSGTFADALKGTVTLKEVNEILNSKKQSYDYLYINVFRKFGIKPDALPEELDKIWDDLGDPVAKLQKYLDGTYEKCVRGVAMASKVPILKPFVPFVVAGPIGIGSIAYLGYVEYAVATKWHGYKANALKLAEDYAKSKLDE